MYKQVIVANKGLNMSRGKLCAQVSHASMAFISWMIRNNVSRMMKTGDYFTAFSIDKNLYENWIEGAFTKIVLAVDDESELNAVIEYAIANGMKEGVDFFCIRDNCLTELTPDETGTRFTCIGFLPMEAEKIDVITRHLKLYR